MVGGIGMHNRSIIIIAGNGFDPLGSQFIAGVL